MKDNISLLTVIKIIALYSTILILILGITNSNSDIYYDEPEYSSDSSSSLLAIFILYSLLAFTISYFCYRNELNKEKTDHIKFINDYPLRYSGFVVLDFQYVFNYDESIINRFIMHLSHSYKQGGIANGLNKRYIEDVDQKLRSNEIRVFHIAEAEPTLLSNHVSLALYTSEKGKSQNVKWWILIRGFLSRDEIIKFFAYSPFTLPFWIFSYLRRKHDLINRLRKVESSFYNYLDLETSIRTLHKTTINDLVEFLEVHGIDTSDLKVQRAQILNIDISGGKTTFGNVVQGARNIVTSKNKTKTAV